MAAYENAASRARIGQKSDRSVNVPAGARGSSEILASRAILEPSAFRVDNIVMRAGSARPSFGRAIHARDPRE